MKIALSRARSSLSCLVTTCTEGASGYTIERRNNVTKQLLRAMKLTGILVLAACLHVSANGSGQNVTLSVKNASLKKVFNEIIMQSGTTIIYNEAAIKTANPVTIDVKNATPQEVLDLSLKGQPFYYSQEDGYIIVKSTPATQGLNPVLQEHHFSDALPPPITGVIRDADGNPLAGVNVVIKGTQRGVTTDANGKFSIEANVKDIIVISSIGYNAREVKIESADLLHIIALSKNVSQLDEVQYIAYGTQTKRFNVGNVATVKGEDIARQPVSNPIAALSGRVPGLIITQSSGVAGSAFKIQLRGQSSIGIDPGTLPPTDPLIIIDGVPFAANNLQTSSVGSALGLAGRSPLNTINPQDIESIEVLKDADATSIYGSRGANGVLLITTKKGKSGKSVTNISAYTGAGKVIKPMPMLNTQQYIVMRREALANDGFIPDQFNAPDLFLWDTTRYTNYQDMLIGNTAQITDAELSFSGGNANTNFIIGSGYHHESTVFPGADGDKRLSFRFNINHQSINQKFKLGFGAMYSSTISNLISSDVTQSTFLTPHTPALYDSTGKLTWQENGVYYDNPLAYTKQTHRSSTNNLLSNLTLSYSPISNLSIRLNAGFNKLQSNEKRKIPIETQNPVFLPRGYLSLGTRGFSSWIVEPQLEYFTSFSKNHIKILVGATWQESLSDGSNIEGTGYTSDALIDNIAAAPTKTISTPIDNEYHYVAGFGRLTYTYSQKYILNLTGRRDGSSRFGPDRQFGTFGSIGAAYIFSSENYFNKISHVISFGKLRGSYGSTGNDQIGDYQYLDLWRVLSAGTPYQGTPGATPQRPFDEDFQWEVNKKLEFGLELGFLNDRIFLNTSYYQNRSSNLLITQPLSSQTGFTSLGMKNFPALVQNTGWEFDLQAKAFTSEKFNWRIGVTLTIPDNKLVSFPGLENSSYKRALVVGEPLNISRLYEFDEIDSQTGLYKVKDRDKNGVLDPNDYITQDLTPKFYGGLSNTLTYKGFELNLFFEGKKVNANNYINEIYLNNSPGFYQFSNYNNQPVAVLNRWRKPGDKAEFQKYTSTYGDAYMAIFNFTSSDAAIIDASFIRLKTASLS
ncbi:MAG: SusC/RagA family TonB-linked outer membrane protein, partial [Chitinophagaceae bacterium]|nr:SusC/RagA family TonB-linked outer membrane protein [Chitinophagaceae bacterium]